MKLHLKALLAVLQRSSLTTGLVSLMLLGLAVFSAGCGRSGAEVTSAAPSPASVKEPTAVATPTLAGPTPKMANEPTTTERPPLSAGTTTPEGPAKERIVFTQVRSVAPP